MERHKLLITWLGKYVKVINALGLGPAHKRGNLKLEESFESSLSHNDDDGGGN